MMALLFVPAITPIDIVLWLVDKDPLRLRCDPTVLSYWTPRELPRPDAAIMANQF
jgi:hypothetical protein